MMPILQLDPLLDSLFSSETINERHFGANLIFDRDRFHADTNGPSGTYGAAVALLGVTTVRYPGGNITELVFDLANPNSDRPSFELVPDYRLFDPDRHGPLNGSLLGLTDALNQIGSQSLSMTFVMPTLRFLGETPDVTGNRPEEVDTALVRTFMLNFLAEAFAQGVMIQAIELGNEWWIDNANLLGGTRMSAIEYGRIASTLAETIQSAIDEFNDSLPFGAIWSEPDIVVQVGPGGIAEMVMPNGHRPPTGYTGQLVEATELIFGQFDRQAEQSAIDAILTHRYQTNELHNVNGWAYRPFETWQQLAANDPDFLEAKYYVTEWNVAARNEEYAGLRQAPAIIALFSEMIVAGVDHANVWAVQQNNDTRLTDNVGWNGDSTVNLSLAGEVFRMLNDSVQGMRAIPLAETTASYSTRAFGSADEIVLYVSSLVGQASEVNFDVASLANRIVSIEGSVLGLIGGNPLDNDALPTIRELSSLIFTRPSEVTFSLGAYQTAEITISVGSGSQGVFSVSASERILGSRVSDQLFGLSGADLIYGFAGTDKLEGGVGDDSLYGGSQRDRLYGGSGNDRLSGDAGSDTIYAGGGNDITFGGSGNDSLFGGTGNDTMFGGSGNDAYIVSTIDQRVFETVSMTNLRNSGGIDVVVSSVNFSLHGSVGVRFVENLTLTGIGNISGTGNAQANELEGNLGNNALIGGVGNDSIDGREGNDRLLGGAGGDRLMGGAGNDRLIGGAGNDIIEGGQGRDALFGGSGDDTFVFNTLSAAEPFDRVIDFNRREDLIHLNSENFRGLTVGALGIAAFTANLSGVAIDASDRVIFETDTGRLFFDADGNGAGRRIHFATLTTDLAVASSDFLVF